jgi:hypothetical protein
MGWLLVELSVPVWLLLAGVLGASIWPLLVLLPEVALRSNVLYNLGFWDGYSHGYDSGADDAQAERTSSTDTLSPA